MSLLLFHSHLSFFFKFEEALSSGVEVLVSTTSFRGLRREAASRGGGCVLLNF